LFDPVFENRCSPLSWLGPQRYTKAPCAIEDIPIIDAVVISHNHYDHLSHPTVLKIQEKHPNVQFFAPLGNKAWFLKCGIKNITEMDWWSTNEIKLSKITAAEPKIEVSKVDVTSTPDPNPSEISAVIGCTPCQHMAARGLFDRAQTLWASWVVESGGKKVWFAGYVNTPSRTLRNYLLILL
jgi:N-acyl-phosphatidylethanolamine-hydrolysing phospholipase D